MEFFRIYTKYSVFIALLNEGIINFKLQFVLCVNSNCLSYLYKWHYHYNWSTMTKIQSKETMSLFDQQESQWLPLIAIFLQLHTGDCVPHAPLPLKNFNLNTLRNPSGQVYWIVTCTPLVITPSFFLFLLIILLSSINYFISNWILWYCTSFIYCNFNSSSPISFK